MVVLNKPVKIILGSGVAILSLWLALVGFTAFQVDSAIRSETPPSILDAPKLPRRQVPFVEPNSPWRKLNLQELTVPDEAVKLAPSMNVTTEMITAETVQVFTRKVVPVEVKSPLILAFLHGAAFTSDVWEYLGTIRLFGAMGYKCLAFDLPEHGQSQGRIGAVEAKRFVSKVQFMTALFKNMTNVVLVAPSMSGHYAIPFALTKPEVLAGLALVAPAASNIVPQSKLKALQVPTLNIYGANDKNLGPSSNLDLRVIPNYQSAVLPDASHAAYIDKPALFHSYLYNFLKKLEKKP